ncbi:hypothetical protein I6G56_00630 (plasmid) [Burkholderia humptydooensis]|uniref:Uncharacterized protein n=1 Tax=Burkholderia humptydooensis TaxID=430531 RepID=A0A7U4P7W9_9BURK|nr:MULTISPECIES: hypothetical protein [Burkholderia]AJY38109.1 hypothetical protein BW21_6168 [Burkholderia sp. 2002721687]ALX44564.1 hypothetical protein AQ610_18610 [Burkholderia humptydooensis]QPS42052.1 hypothetical protein I6G56_00630 [Burkholderia humptydooensis]
MRNPFLQAARRGPIALAGVALATLLSGCAPATPNGAGFTSTDAGTQRTPYVSTTPALLCRGCEMH